MSDDQHRNWLAAFGEGGIPQILLGPAGSAISRLLGSAVEIPAAYLDGFSQRIKDKNEARSRLYQALTEKAIDAAVVAPDRVQRILDSLLSKELRREENKIGVARAAISDLANDPPSDGGKEPSEQFMTKFERFAEDAAEPNIQELFGKILAGEIRKPKSVSAATLQFVSLLDAESAARINKVLPACWLDVAILDAISPTLNLADVTYLEQVGFWTGEKVLPQSFDADGKILKTPRRNSGFVVFGEVGKSIRLQIAILSREGRELLQVLNPPVDYEALAKMYRNNGADHFFSGKTTYFDDQVSVSFDKKHY